MKRSIDIKLFLEKKQKYNNYDFKFDLSLEPPNYLTNPKIILNKDSYIYIISYDLGTKIGLIMATKFIKNIKLHGKEYIIYFIEDYFPKEAFSYVQDYYENYPSVSPNFNKLDLEDFNKSFKEFSSGFFLYFFKYLELNIKDNIDLKCWIQDILN